MTAYRTPARVTPDPSREAADARRCKTCKSSRCGNHAACARRYEASAARSRGWWIAWDAMWSVVCAGVYMSAYQRSGTKPTLAELERVRRTAPDVYAVLQSVAVARLRNLMGLA